MVSEMPLNPHCGKPYVGGYFIVEHPMYVAMLLWYTLYIMGGYIIVKHPMYVAKYLYILGVSSVLSSPFFKLKIHTLFDVKFLKLY